MKYFNDPLIEGGLLLAIGFVFGKFVSTAVIQLSIWKRIALLGIRPPFKSTFKIFIEQTVLGWDNKLTGRCLVISLITALCFLIFWFRYGSDVIFIFCCIYCLFIEMFLFSWLDDLEIPEFIYTTFILFGGLASYFTTSNQFFVSFFFLTFYFLLNYTPSHRILRIRSNPSFIKFKFFVSIIVWFGILPSLLCALFSCLTTIIIRDTKNYPELLSVKYELINPVMCVVTFIYTLYIFPSAL